MLLDGQMWILILIKYQLTTYKNSWVLSNTKTVNSDRTIEFIQVLRQYLMNLKQKQEMNRRELGIFYKSNRIYDIRNEKLVLFEIDDFINVKQDGEMLNSFSHKVISRIAKKEFNLNFKYHNLRHTYATKLLEGGASIKFVQ